MTLWSSLLFFIPEHNSCFKAKALIHEPYFSSQRTGNSQTESETPQKEPREMNSTIFLKSKIHFFNPSFVSCPFDITLSLCQRFKLGRWVNASSFTCSCHENLSEREYIYRKSVGTDNPKVIRSSVSEAASCLCKSRPANSWHFLWTVPAVRVLMGNERSQPQVRE